MPQEPKRSADIETPSSRWPRLQNLCEKHDHPGGLSKLLNNGAWLFTPAFLDSGERALRTLEEMDMLASDTRVFVDSLARHVAAQTKPNKCVEAIGELAAAVWLAERGALACHPTAINPANNLIDLRATIAGHEVGVEVKSDFDTFEGEFMGGTFKDDPHALGRKLRARFGSDVRSQFSWIGERPTREAWGPVWTRLRNEFSQAISEATDLRPGEKRVFRKLFDEHERLGRCDGVEVVVFRGPLVTSYAQFAGDGWEEVASRVARHARGKASRTNVPFLLLYVSQAPQKASIDPSRLAEVKREYLAGGENLPPSFLGLIHLELTPSNRQAPVARGFLMSRAPIPPKAFVESLDLIDLPEPTRYARTRRGV